MPPTFSTSSLEVLLASLADEPSCAAEEYEILRLKITRLMLWRGCPEAHADSLTDITLDRIAEKIAGGEKIENIRSYSSAVARFVWMEHTRKHKEDAYGDDLPHTSITPDIPDPEAEFRISCLRQCMAEVMPDEKDRRMLLGYYDPDPGRKNKDHRKQLAEMFGLTLTNLKVKACRLRMRLEICITDCVGRNSVTKGRGLTL